MKGLFDKPSEGGGFLNSRELKMVLFNGKPSFKYPASESFSNNPLHIEILYSNCRGALAWYTIFQNPFI